MAIAEDPSSPHRPQYSPARSGEDRRKVNIPPAPGSPVRSGKDRRQPDQRGGTEPKNSQVE